MLSPEMETRIRVDLDDEAESIWSEEKIRNAISSAVSDLSRVLPLEKRYDHTLSFTVTAEGFTALAAGTYASLDNAMVEPQSETVTNAAADTTYTRDTDYTMDYFNGKITIIAAGDITVGDVPLISYTKHKAGCDVSSIASELLRIERVEYPAGYIPRNTVSYEKWKDYLTLTSPVAGSQVTLSDGKHVWIYYHAEQTPPTATAVGSYPVFLDEAIIAGAKSYALFLRVLQLIELARTSATSGTTDTTNAATQNANAVTELGKCAAKITLAATALTSMATKIGTAETAIDSVTDMDTHLSAAVIALNLVQVATDMIADADAAFNAAAAELALGAGFLQTGDAAIPTANVGKDVAENWRQYAEAEAALGSQYNREGEGRVSMANAIISEAAQRISIAQANLEKWNNKSDKYLGSASGYQAQAAQYMAQADNYVKQAVQYLQASQLYLQSATAHANQVSMYISISEKVSEQAVRRQTDFWSILNDKLQLRRPVSSVPVRQPA